MSRSFTPFIKAVIFGVIFSLLAVSSVMADTPDKTPSSIPSGARIQSTNPSSPGSNLAIYSPQMKLVLRYDAEANSLVATVSDKDGAALWYAKTVTLSRNSSDGSITMSALAVLKFGQPVWVDWQKFTIKLNQDLSVTITKVNPIGKTVYEGKAVKISTTIGDK